jgi:hypothetical protein
MHVTSGNAAKDKLKNQLAKTLITIGITPIAFKRTIGKHV